MDAVIMGHKKSATYCKNLQNFIPGAAHYNFHEAWQPKDIVFSSGVGARITDIDGNEYLDLYSNFGSNIFGHSNVDYLELVFREISRVSSNSLSDLSFSVSQEICNLIPCAESVRYSVTGTEAVQAAVRLSRAFTGKQKFLRFSGNYHGHSDNMLGGKPADKGQHPFPIDFPGDPRGSKGLANDVRKNQSLLIEWNNLELLESTVKEYHNDIACIITEVLAVNAGGIEPKAEFLLGMRRLCDQYNIVLIFDEIITGFRVGMGGAQALYGVTPDLVTLGKAMGGGMLPVSAVAGKKTILDQLAKHQVVHAGTFNGYHAGLAAVKATLSLLQSEKDNISKVSKNGLVLQDIIASLAKAHDLPIITQGHPSCFYLHVKTSSLLSTEEWTADIKFEDAKLQKIFLEKGILLAPISRFYPSVTLSESDIEFFQRRVDLAFSEYKKVINYA